jgi:hypothetical protein
MQTQIIFRILLPLIILTFALHRGYYVRKHGKEENSLNSHVVARSLRNHINKGTTP